MAPTPWLLETAMNTSNPGHKAPTKPRTDAELADADSDEIDAAFWDSKQNALVETESQQISGRYEIGINGRAYPVTDCARGTVDGVEALGIILVTNDIPGPLLLSENNPLRIKLDGLVFISTVAEIDVNGPIVTVWITEPDIVSRFHGETPRGWYLEDYDTEQSGKQMLIGA